MELDGLLACLDDPVLQTIIARRLEGYSNWEIAEYLDLTTRTIERKLGQMRGLDFRTRQGQ